MNRPLNLSLAVALALVSPGVLALGLGTIEVKSKMNEPLVAEIPVITAGPEEAEQLKVRLAGAEDFKRIGLDPSTVSVPLMFDVTQGENGDPVIRVISDAPVREPFMSFLVEVNWANGRLLREFSLLLDPPVAPAVVGTRTRVEPVVERVAPAPEPLPPSPNDAPAAPEPAAPVAQQPEPAPAAEEPATSAPEPAAEASAPPAPSAPVAERAPGEYGPVAEGETLWEIANNTRAEGVSVNQMMLALLRANPDAFFKDNVNALKRGAILRIPERADAQTLSNAEAAASITAQAQAWRGDAPSLVADTGYSEPTLAATPAPPARDDSRLELVPPRVGSDSIAANDQPGAAGGTDRVATAELARTREQLASREQESGELRTRVQELERIKTDSDRLLNLRNSEVAELQRRLQAAEAEAERLRATNAAAAAASTAATATPAPEMATPPVDAGATPAAGTTPTSDAPTPATDANAATDAGAADGGGTDAAAAAAVAGLAGSDAATDATATNPDGTPAEATAATDAEGTPLATDPDGGATAVPTDASATPPDGTPLAAVDGTVPPVDAAGADTAATDAGGAEVTPLGESAPVSTEAVARPPQWQAWLKNPLVMGGAALLAVLALVGLVVSSRRRKAAAVAAAEPRASVADSFGAGVFGDAAGSLTDPEEERELLERLAADPTDVDAHLDLLRLYYANRDAEKFEAAAGALYAQLPGTDSPAWQEAVAMGRELSPGSPLFEDADGYAPEAAREEFDFATLEQRLEEEDRARGLEPFETDARETTTHVETTRTVETVTRAADDEFDFNLIDEPAAPAAQDEIRRPSVSEFDLELDRPELTTQQLPSLDLDFGTPPAREPEPEAPRPGEFFSGDDAVGTKLDLARAYLDMGDPEGARSMLQEVMGEGSAAQRAEAQKLLAEI